MNGNVDEAAIGDHAVNVNGLCLACWRAGVMDRYPCNARLLTPDHAASLLRRLRDRDE